MKGVLLITFTRSLTKLLGGLALVLAFGKRTQWAGPTQVDGNVPYVGYTGYILGMCIVCILTFPSVKIMTGREPVRHKKEQITRKHAYQCHWRS